MLVGEVQRIDRSGLDERVDANRAQLPWTPQLVEFRKIDHHVPVGRVFVAHDDLVAGDLSVLWTDFLVTNPALAPIVQLMQVHRLFVGGGAGVGLDAQRHQRDVEGTFPRGAEVHDESPCLGKRVAGLLPKRSICSGPRTVSLALGPKSSVSRQKERNSSGTADPGVGQCITWNKGVSR